MQHSFIKKDDKSVIYEDVSDLLNPIELTKHKGEENFLSEAVKGTWGGTEAPIQSVSRLPEEFAPLHTGHAGTHKFMVDDFCQAVVSGYLSPTNAWQAARYNLPGLIGHESAMRGGVCLAVPDAGDPPAHIPVLSEDRTENPDNYSRFRKKE